MAGKGMKAFDALGSTMKEVLQALDSSDTRSWNDESDWYWPTSGTEAAQVARTRSTLHRLVAYDAITGLVREDGTSPKVRVVEFPRYSDNFELQDNVKGRWINTAAAEDETEEEDIEYEEEVEEEDESPAPTTKSKKMPQSNRRRVGSDTRIEFDVELVTARTESTLKSGLVHYMDALTFILDYAQGESMMLSPKGEDQWQLNAGRPDESLIAVVRYEVS